MRVEWKMCNTDIKLKGLYAFLFLKKGREWEKS